MGGGGKLKGKAIVTRTEGKKGKNESLLTSFTVYIAVPLSANSSSKRTISSKNRIGSGFLSLSKSIVSVVAEGAPISEPSLSYCFRRLDPCLL